MKHLFLSRQAFFILIIIAVTVLTQSSCKENILINSKVSPAINTINLFSTSLPCITHTYYDDTATTSTTFSGIPIYQGIGNITDPYFGTMTGATFFQVIPTHPGFGIYDSCTIDSAVLVLPYSGFTYGDTTSGTLQSYQAFYMNQPISIDTAYFSYSNRYIDASFPLSEPTSVDIRPWKDSFDYGITDQYYPGLRMKLKLSTLKQHLLHADSAMIGSTNPNKDFINAFTGICVRAADTRLFTTTYPYFQLNGSTVYSQAGILVYYHRTYTAGDSAHMEHYYFNSNSCAHFNSDSRSYAHAPVNSLYHSTATNDAVIALQNAPGAAIDIVIPGLKSLPAGIISKAELRLPVLPGSTYGNYITNNQFLGPSKIYPTGIGNGIYPTGINYGLAYILSDYYPLTSTTPLSVLDGYLHTIDGKEMYTIDIPREVMTSLKANNDTIHLHINGTQDFYGAAHLVLGGGSYPDTLYRPKLFVVYSKLN